MEDNDVQISTELQTQDSLANEPDSKEQSENKSTLNNDVQTENEEGSFGVHIYYFPL